MPALGMNTCLLPLAASEQLKAHFLASPGVNHCPANWNPVSLPATQRVAVPGVASRGQAEGLPLRRPLGPVAHTALRRRLSCPAIPKHT